jgi:hypothetical protein
MLVRRNKTTVCTGAAAACSNDGPAKSAAAERDPVRSPSLCSVPPASTALSSGWLRFDIGFGRNKIEFVGLNLASHAGL